MSSCQKRLSYQASCQRFLIKHTLFLLLQILGIGEYIFIVVAPTGYVILATPSLTGIRQILLLIFPLFFLLMAGVASLGVYRYGKGLVSFLKGNVLRQTGYLVQHTKNHCILADNPFSVKHPPAHLTYFHLRRQNCANDWQIGDKITVIYPCSHLLRVYSVQQRQAIYAHSAQTPLDTMWLKNSTKASVYYLGFVTLIAALLLSVLYFVTRLLLQHTFFA